MGHRFSPTTYPRAAHARLSVLVRAKVPQAGRTSCVQPRRTRGPSQVRDFKTKLGESDATDWLLTACSDITPATEH